MYANEREIRGPLCGANRRIGPELIAREHTVAPNAHYCIGAAVEFRSASKYLWISSLSPIQSPLFLLCIGKRGQLEFALIGIYHLDLPQSGGTVRH